MSFLNKCLSGILFTISFVFLSAALAQAQFEIELEPNTNTAACLGVDKVDDFIIIIRETQTDDFALGGIESYIKITPPTGFEFENSDGDRDATASDSSLDIFNTSAPSLINNTLTITVTTRTLEEGETAVLDTIIISGLEIRKTSNSAHTLCCL